MEARRIRALGLIERLKRHEMEAEAQEMGRLRSEANRLERRREELLEQSQTASYNSDPSLVPYLGNYVRSLRSEIGRAERDRARIDPDLRAIENRMSLAFREMKTYESVRKAAEARLRQQVEQAEEFENADQALNQWWRKRGRSR
ncbi:MAG: hypothetical protein ACU0FH_02505 [Heliomarina sp.]|uniref:hypothetical protein n=1 Tax=Heliomarina sp. TaxID=2917556 RepID=UPI0040589469